MALLNRTDALAWVNNPTREESEIRQAAVMVGVTPIGTHAEVLTRVQQIINGLPDPATMSTLDPDNLPADPQAPRTPKKGTWESIKDKWPWKGNQGGVSINKLTTMAYVIGILIALASLLAVVLMLPWIPVNGSPDTFGPYRKNFINYVLWANALWFGLVAIKLLLFTKPATQIPGTQPRTPTTQDIMLGTALSVAAVAWTVWTLTLAHTNPGLTEAVIRWIVAIVLAINTILSYVFADAVYRSVD